MTPRAKRLLIDCHPDRHGGDHSRMEQFYEKTKRVSQAKAVKNYCPFCADPVRINSNSRTCLAHRRRAVLVPWVSAMLLILAGCSTPKPADTIKAAMELAPKRLVASQSSAIAGLPNTNTASITLKWNPGPIGTPSGFKVLHGAGGSYTNSINVGNTLAATITGLKPATLYYFAVSAYNEDGLESEPSEEIAEMTPGIVLQPLLNLTPYILRLTISSLTPGKTNFLQFTTTPTAPFVWITELSFVPLDPVWGMFVTNDVPSKLYRVVVTP